MSQGGKADRLRLNSYKITDIRLRSRIVDAVLESTGKTFSKRHYVVHCSLIEARGRTDPKEKGKGIA